MQEINALLQKYNHFKYEQIRHIEQREDGSKIVTLVVLDENGEDQNTIKLTFSGITASKILVNDVLSFLDMGDGITLIEENGLYGFATGHGTAMLHVNSAPLYIIASELTIEEN